MPQPGTVFLMYHELSLPGRALCQPEPGYTRYVVAGVDFRSQMQELVGDGWRGTNVTQALDSLSSDSPSGRKNVCITFDDGCETDLLSAAPILQAAGFNATFYITVGFLGKAGYMTEAQLRNLNSLEFEIGCHSFTHPYLPDLDRNQLQEETATAKLRLEQIIGAPVVHFSCPGGRWNERVVEAVRGAGFRTMATSRTGVNFAGSDEFSLSRVAILGGTSLKDFMRTCRGDGLAWIQFQERARDAAKRMLGNSTYDSLRSLLLRKPEASRPDHE